MTLNGTLQCNEFKAVQRAVKWLGKGVGGSWYIWNVPNHLWTLLVPNTKRLIRTEGNPSKGLTFKATQTPWKKCS